MAPLDERYSNRDATNFTESDYREFYDYGFAPNHGKNEYTFFGVREAQLVKIVYSIEENDDGDF